MTGRPDASEQSSHAMASILLATLPSLAPPHFLESVIAHAASHSSTRLIIVLFSRHFNLNADPNIDGSRSFSELQAVSHTGCWDIVQRILTFTYVQATKVAWQANNVLMPIDVLLKGFNEDLDPTVGIGMDVCFRVSGDSIAVPLPESVSLLPQSYIPLPDNHFDVATATSTPPEDPEAPTPPFYPVTAIGGTFDHLHSGHKILLSMAAWITKQKLIVGVTDDVLLQSKVNKGVIESITTRIERVRDFLKLFKPDLSADVVPITDVYGPTAWDPNIQALVVSKETIRGADAIATLRTSKDLPPLHTFFIDVISSTSVSLDHKDMIWLKDHKMSSSFIRQWMVEREQSKPVDPDQEAGTSAPAN